MNKYFIFLEKLRRSGVTNMFGAAPYLVTAFPEIDYPEARKILVNWMETYRREDYENIIDNELEEY